MYGLCWAFKEPILLTIRILYGVETPAGAWLCTLNCQFKGVANAFSSAKGDSIHLPLVIAMAPVALATAHTFKSRGPYNLLWQLIAKSLFNQMRRL